MRERSSNQARQTETIVSDAPTIDTLHELIATRRRSVPSAPSAGKHRAPAASVIPEQRPRKSHDLGKELAAIEAVQVVAEERAPTPHIPLTASWRASQLPRVFTAALLVLALAGTWVLGMRFESSRLPGDCVSMFIGVGVVVVLWALLIATTPQELTLRGSVLTIHNRAGSESFDLADSLHPVDIVSDPRSRKWAVLLHRSDRTSVVLRRHDVNAVELDPIVRHYREIVGRRFSGPAARPNH